MMASAGVAVSSELKFLASLHGLLELASFFDSDELDDNDDDDDDDFFTA